MADPVRLLNENDFAMASAQLTALRDRAQDASCFVGFDGFVDSIIDVVAQRHAPGPSGYDRMTSLRGFADRANDAAGRSANVELVVKQVRAGGNGPILAGALARLGASVHCAGALERPVFDELRASCASTTCLGEPGATDALEFDDGKLMQGKSSSMDRITWDHIVTQSGGLDAVIGRCNEAHVIAPCGWTMIPGMNDIWTHLADEVLPSLDPSHERIVFADFSDPAKRTEADLQTAIGLLQRMNATTPVTLGLNLAEAKQVALLMGIDPQCETDPGALATIAGSIRSAIGLRRIAVHHHQGAAIDDELVRCAARTAFTPTPKTSTGAGDHFNAGLCFALAHDLEAPTALACAIATSGLFVRTGQHPPLVDVVTFIEQMPDPGG
jgi:hypothetical protein